MNKIPVSKINYSKLFIKTVVFTAIWCVLALLQDFIRFKLPVRKLNTAYVITGIAMFAVAIVYYRFFDSYGENIFSQYKGMVIKAVIIMAVTTVSRIALPQVFYPYMQTGRLGYGRINLSTVFTLAEMTVFSKPALDIYKINSTISK